MKKLLYLILTGTLFISCAVTHILVNFDEPIVRTFDVSGIKDELFINANRWMISIFTDAKSIIQYSDKIEGILMGKYLLNTQQYIYAIIEITVKDDKARISVTPDNWNYNYYNYGIPYWSGTDSKYYYTKEEAESDINALCESFFMSLQSKKTEF